VTDPANSSLKELLTAACEEQLTPEQYAQLDRLIRHDAAARIAYLRHTQLEANLRRLRRADAAATSSSDSYGLLQAVAALTDSETPVASLHDTMVAPAIHGIDIEQPKPVHRPLPLPRGAERKISFANRRFLAWAALIVLSLVLLTIVLNHAKPRVVATAPPTTASKPVMVATLTHALGATWQGASTAPAVGSHFPDRTTLRLATGYAEFTFASGADILTQAPTVITIHSNNSVSLKSGKLVAHVPAPARGFYVSAGQSTITDLGTDFAVSVDSSGTQVEVFKGKVVARAPSTQPTLLTANDAAKIDPAGHLKLDRGGAVPQLFVTQLAAKAPSLDLVDLAAGGDGTTARRGPAIDAATGKYGRPTPIADVTAPGGYHRVSLPVIDGCFVPNAGSTQIDSAGHRFVFAGASGLTFDRILVANKNIWPRKSPAEKFPLPPLSTRLAGVDYDRPPHDFLFMHASSGLTFDLKAIDNLHPDQRVTAFRCLIGNPATANDVRTSNPPATAASNVFVLVDGVVRFERLNLTYTDPPVNVDVPLGPHDHFLTLGVSQAGSNIGFAWVLFADPRIKLSVAPAAGGAK